MKLLPVISLLAAASIVAAQEPGETKDHFDTRTKWWREAKFGMFIHWGLYAVPADNTTWDGKKSIAEWYFSNHRVQVKDYEKFAGQFNPVNFDAHKWVATAKNAGMKYIVITSKHHDGFCMFDSKLTDYCITKATPFKRDPMKELAAECKKQGLKLCFYHSVMDWHEPDYLPRRPWDERPVGDANLDRYIDHMKGQLKELLTNYGPIGGIWFDGGWEHSPEQLHAKEVVASMRAIQPNIMVNDRIDIPEDYSTPEQTIPANAMPNGRLWETCMTLNDTWGYARNDHNWKSSSDLIHKLCDIASKGGNFLLNVGPTDLGDFTPETMDRLATVGNWMKVNGKSIYGTAQSPFKKGDQNWRCTRKGNSLFVQVFEWPTDGLKLSGLQTPIKTIQVLGGGKAAFTTSESDGIKTLTIDRPATLDPYATVVEIQLSGAPVVAAMANNNQVSANSNGDYELKASQAEIRGNTAQLEHDNGNIGYWTRLEDSVVWNLKVANEGDYSVQVDYACENGTDGGTYLVGPDRRNSVQGKVESTGSWYDYKTTTLPGSIHLKPGQAQLQVIPLTKPGFALMNLRSIRLTRANVWLPRWLLAAD